MTTRGYSQVVHGGSDAGGDPAEVWTWTEDMSPRAGDTRTWYGMLVDATGQHVGQSGVTVYWTLTVTSSPPNASLSASSSTTDARGIATVTATYTADGTADDTITVSGSLSP